MSYYPQMTGGTPGWNDPPQDLGGQKYASAINRRARPVDPSCQSAAPYGNASGYGGQPQQYSDQSGYGMQPQQGFQQTAYNGNPNVQPGGGGFASPANQQVPNQMGFGPPHGNPGFGSNQPLAPQPMPVHVGFGGNQPTPMPQQQPYGGGYQQQPVRFNPQSQGQARGFQPYN